MTIFNFFRHLVSTFFLVIICFSVDSVYGQNEEPFQGNVTLTYDEAITFYENIANKYPQATLLSSGKSDAGTPMHILLLDKDGAKSPSEIAKNKVVIWINNGIHPGEPCGVDASVKLVKNILSESKKYAALLDHATIVVVPIYNVGGSLNRGCCSRANQNGPENYGFRGNARNLDLNRDFVKCDSQNAKWFNQTFNKFNPHMMMDTHTSNGADYQYVMTMINTQADKASLPIGKFIREKSNPEIYSKMESRGWGMTPYVHTLGRIPDEGIMDFLETPRYSTGYAALFNCIGYTSETHMLKPFAQRVESTYQFLLATIEFANENHLELISLKDQSDKEVSEQKEFALQWELDTTQFREIQFKGFKAEFPRSEVTGKEQLQYNRSQPFEKSIRFYDHYTPTIVVEAPQAYVIPQAWHEVIERLQWNGVSMYQIQESQFQELEVYYIHEFDSSPRIYEGHHPNSIKKMDKVEEELALRPGDWIVPVNQSKNRYIVETLEPQGVDAFFVWNFFDSAMQQKEWFSDYVFESTAKEMLSNDPDLKEKFEVKKQNEPEFAQDSMWQLYWLYRQSENFEPLNRYPVYRLNDLDQLKP